MNILMKTTHFSFKGKVASMASLENFKMHANNYFNNSVFKILSFHLLQTVLIPTINSFLL